MRTKLLVPITFLLLILTLVSAETTRDEALAALNVAEQDLNSMINDGFPVTLINDTYMAAKQAFERADFAQVLTKKASGELADLAKKSLEGLDYEGFSYGGVIEKTKEVTALKEQAYGIADSIRAIEIKIEEYEAQDVDISECDENLEELRATFNQERYDEAEQMASELNSKLEEKRAELAKLNVMVNSSKSFFEKHWKGFLIFLIAAGAFGYFMWKRFEVKRLKKKIANMEVEGESLIELLKKTQKARYKDGNITAFIYNVRVEMYNKRINDIKEELPVLEAMLERAKKHNLFRKKRKK